jgi:NitT/TauT family transport system substrate-binding protein
MAALLSGKTEITAHFTTPPFSYLELQDLKIHRVLNSVDVIGHTSLALAFSTRQFAEENPTAVKAFLAALREANEFIKANRDEAAGIFVATSDVKVPDDLARKIVADPDTIYDAIPKGTKDYMDFMSSVGILKSKANSWQLITSCTRRNASQREITGRTS